MKLLEALVVTAEMTGTELSTAALKMMEADLLGYPLQSVFDALNKCRKELTGRLTLAAIIQRINATDGRPESDEAWATAIGAQSESATVVWTEDMEQAFFDARPLLENGDKTGARMAFKNSYERRSREAREAGKPVAWTVSLGHDPAMRETALVEAAIKGRLTQQYVAGLLPYREGSDAKDRLSNLLQEANVRLIGKKAA